MWRRTSWRCNELFCGLNLDMPQCCMLGRGTVLVSAATSSDSKGSGQWISASTFLELVFVVSAWPWLRACCAATGGGNRILYVRASPSVSPLVPSFGEPWESLYRYPSGPESGDAQSCWYDVRAQYNLM